MSESISDAEAVRRFPEIQSLVDVRQAGWNFRPITDDNGSLVGISGSYSVQQYTDAIFIFDRTNVTAARVVAEEYGGGCVWSREGADLQEVVYDILGLPEPGAPGAPHLVKRSNLLWTPR
jgi:hypothetical protein